MNSLINRCLVILLLFCSTQYTVAQERYLDERYIFTQSYINPYLVNVGATGFDGYQQIFLNYRNKWSTFDGSPKTITIGYNGPVADRLGLGIIFLQDSYGGLKITKGQLSFSYMIESPKNKINFGLSGEFIEHKVDDVINGFTDIDDQLLLSRLDGTQFFDASFGVFGLYDKKIEYGLAIPSLVSSRLDEDENNERELGFIFSLGYKMTSKTTGINLTPSIMVKKLNEVPTHIDLNARFGFLEDKFTSGITYTVGADKRLGFLLGTNVDALNVYYSYNVSSHDFQDYNNGSHEIMMTLNLGTKKEKEFILNPEIN